MQNDLNLAQALGGLRIANPDELDSPVSPGGDSMRAPSPVSPPASSNDLAATTPTNHRHSGYFPPSRPDSSGRVPSESHAAMERIPSPSINTGVPIPGPEVDRFANGSPPMFDRQLSYPAYHELSYADHMPGPSVPYDHHSPSHSGAARPVSMFPQTSASSATSPMHASPYRIRSESARSSVSGPVRRSNSRGSGAAMQAGVPSRDGSYSDRYYRQSQPMMSSHAPFPPRMGSNAPPMDASLALPPPAEAPLSPSDQPYASEGGPLSSSEEWKERGAARGIQREIDRDGRPVTKVVKKGVKDFNFGRTLGEGSYSTVIAATDRQTLREYAVKVLDKKHIIRERKVKYVSIEKDTLNRLTDHPGIVRLYYTFQDERSLYYVLDVASGGELLGVLKRMGTFDEECTRFYGAQILDAVDYMHSRGVIHRDLKPENVLLDDNMHVKITDFGTAKILDPPRPSNPWDMSNGANGVGGAYPGDPLDGVDEDDRAKSFVGTAEYVSPELLRDKSACKASDLWAFGCIIYQLLAGRPPFKAGNEYLTFQKIVGLEYEYPAGFPLVARDLVDRLLVLDPAKRLSIEHIKRHEFFRGITWGKGLWKQKAPRLKSYVPPSQAPSLIRLDSQPNNASQLSLQRPSVHTQGSNGNLRPQPRVITELPPPSQVDLDWSPVLTSSHERILKLGNLIVHSGPAPPSPTFKNGDKGDGKSEMPTPKRFSRFFGVGATKKRQRLVMITSSARIVIAPANGDEKKMKDDISLLSPGVNWKSVQDSKGVTWWRVDTLEKQYSFEDPSPRLTGPLDPLTPTEASTKEWLDTVERATNLARTRNETTELSIDVIDDELVVGRSVDYRPPISRSSTSLPRNGGGVGIGIGMGGPDSSLDHLDELGPMAGGSGHHTPSGAAAAAAAGGGRLSKSQAYSDMDAFGSGNGTGNGLGGNRGNGAGAGGSNGGGGGGGGGGGIMGGKGRKIFGRRLSKNGLTAVF